jgi:hypothetical protein
MDGTRSGATGAEPDTHVKPPQAAGSRLEARPAGSHIPQNKKAPVRRLGPKKLAGWTGLEPATCFLHLEISHFP